MDPNGLRVEIHGSQLESLKGGVPITVEIHDLKLIVCEDEEELEDVQWLKT